MKRLHPVTGTNYKDYISTCAPIIFFSALTGVASGAVVILYSYCAEVLTHNSIHLYELVMEHPAFIPLLLIALVILAFISYVILKFIPEVKGSGIPRTEGVIRGLKPIVWWRTLVGTILGSFVSFFAGLSLGVEGPSIAVGSAVGAGVSKLHKSKRLNDEKKKQIELLVTTSGASAALTAVFKAPITGLIFTLEELHQKFSPLILLAAGSSITTSILTSTGLRYLLGMEQTALNIALNPLPFEYSWALVLLGVVCGVLSALFNKALCLVGEINFLKRIPMLVKLIAVFLITGVVGLFVTEALGGGMLLVKNLTEIDFTWWALLILLVVKAFLTVLALGSNSSGGILLPLLSIGALIGALMGKAFIAMGISEEYYVTFIIIAMSSFLGATFRTPITAIVLMVEITGSLSGVLTIGIEVLIAFIVAELMMRKPIYDVILERDMEEEQAIIPPFKFKSRTKKS